MATHLEIVHDIFGKAFRISRWYIPGHDGIDLPAKTGTPIRAVSSGVVSYARDARIDPHAGRAWAIGGGNVVNIDIGDNLTTQYAHLNQIYVANGQRVKAGQIIGTVGSTGGTPNSPNASFGASNAHLHFGLWDHKTNKMIEPTTFLLAARAGWTNTGKPPDASPDQLGAWGDNFRLPVGKTLTQSDIDSMISTLRDLGYFTGAAGPLPGLGEYQARAVLQGFIGKPWTKQTQDEMQAAFGVAAQQNSSDAYLGAIFGPFSDIARNLSDPGLWIRVLALIIGIGIAGYGTINVLRSTAAPANVY